MKVDAAILRRLAALNMPAECFSGVLSILADLQGADDARLTNQRERTRRSRRKTRDCNVTDTLRSRDGNGDNPPHTPLKEERKTPEANASGGDDAATKPTQAQLERELFSRGRQVCGKNSGGLIASLLKSRNHDVALARSVLELAATKHDAREYVAAAMKGNSNGHRSQSNGIKEACDELRADLARASGDEPEFAGMRDITPGSR